MRTTQSAGHRVSDGTDEIVSHVDRNDRVRRVLHPIQRATVPLPVNFGVFNAHSIHNKTADICDWISASNLRFAAVGNDLMLTLLACELIMVESVCSIMVHYMQNN
jgi:hypothetical protein